MNVLKKISGAVIRVLGATMRGDLPFKKAPTSYNADGLIRLVNSGLIPRSSSDGDKWVLCRTEGYFSVFSRVELAWKVFTGEADALTWSQGQ